MIIYIIAYSWAQNEEGKMTEQSPVITLPDDLDLQRRLRAKLEEYKKRLASYSFTPPEHNSDIDTQIKIDVLEKLLSDGEIKTWDLSRELATKYHNYHPFTFENACSVIDVYCGHARKGQTLRGGTGLPE